MGLDLTLLPFDGEFSTTAFSHTTLNCVAARDIYDFLTDEPKMRVPAGFTSFYGRDEAGNTAYGKTEDTPYGEPLMFVEIESLLKLKVSHIVQEYPQNAATWAYLEKLPPRTKVALYWH